MRDEIEKDRAEGTPGPWEVLEDKVSMILSINKTVYHDDWGFLNEADTRRAARVPALEDAYLAACELADAVEWYHSAPGQDFGPLAATLAKFRAIK